ncbi:hypothetical protein [Pseudoalteromonas maricaloris]|uniref:hypothetical protein n=1 Tax=Pseudoalteromonas maricaloris TaxID=184924 RepID=UPI00068DCD52|nr:hypothetical protein [Pseudoalteromonas flavipulchra]MBD0782996.1 hypothetical protein [Pseudoalteromonas flavipulchra]MBE0374749.1 hypothetical protein [Pseudoalteromonas flavipulchra NCIMB 2033 = ATCC BAA-314]
MNIVDLINNKFKAPEPITIAKVKISTELASQLLEINIDNIPPVASKVALYADAMSNGRWQYNGDSIRVSSDGRLLDGQNRLLACIESGVTIESNLVVGLEDNVFNTIDQGRVRQKSHLLARNFNDSIRPSEANMLNTAITRILKHDRGFSQTTNIARNATKSMIVTTDDVSYYLLEHPELIEQARYVKNRFGSRSILPIPTVLYMYHIGSRFDQKYTAKFLDKMVLGVGLAESETLMYMNSFLIRLKVKTLKWSTSEKENTLVKVWNSVGRAGLYSIVHSGNLKYRPSDPVPFFQAPKQESIEQMLAS